jgi:RNase P subunit RPR2
MRWVCTKCSTPVHPDVELQPTTDAKGRWRIGRCLTCKDKRAIFQQEKP